MGFRKMTNWIIESKYNTRFSKSHLAMRQKNAYWKIWSEGGRQLYPSPRHYPAAFAHLHFGGDCPRHLVPQLMRSSVRLGEQERVRKGAVFWLHNLKKKRQIQKKNQMRKEIHYSLLWSGKTIAGSWQTKKIINEYFYVKIWKLSLFSVFTVLYLPYAASTHSFILKEKIDVIYRYSDM